MKEVLQFQLSHLDFLCFEKELSRRSSNLKIVMSPGILSPKKSKSTEVVEIVTSVSAPKPTTPHDAEIRQWQAEEARVCQHVVLSSLLYLSRRCVTS